MTWPFGDPAMFPNAGPLETVEFFDRGQETLSVLFYGPSSLLVVCKGGGATAALPLAPKGDLDDILSRVQR